jgi:hypothetical protein
MRLLSCLSTVLLSVACSAGGAPDKRSGSGDPSDPTSNPDDVFMGDLGGGDPRTPNGETPRNIGSEAACDGLDENENGIIDDVDVGMDGLCDCLHIGFLGGISGESGQTTGTFAAWLEERSDVPIQQIDAQTPLSADLLAGLQVLIVGNLVQRTHSGAAPYYSAAEVSALSDWVQAGGGLMALAGYTSSAQAVLPSNELLTPEGVSYDLTTFPGSGNWTQPNTDLGVSYVVHGFSPHPTTDGVTTIER